MGGLFNHFSDGAKKILDDVLVEVKPYIDQAKSQLTTIFSEAKKGAAHTEVPVVAEVAATPKKTAAKKTTAKPKTTAAAKTKKSTTAKPKAPKH